MKRIIITIIIAAVLLLGGCSGGREEPPAEESQSEMNITDTENSITQQADPFGLSFSGSALYDNGVVRAGKSGGLNNSASFTPSETTYRVSLLFTAEPGVTGAVYFLSDGKGDGYRLSLNPRKHKAVLGVLDRGEVSSSITSPCDIREGEPFRITADIGEESVRICFGDDPDAPESMRFDVARNKDAGSMIVFDCGSSADTSFADITLSDLPGRTGQTYQNPVLGSNAESADPFILCDGGTYYLYSTSAPMEGYRVKASEDLLSWRDCGLCLRKDDVYGEPTQTAGFWAPEVYALGSGEGKRYALLYTVDEHVGIAFADSPTGPFKSVADSYLVKGSKAIDPTLFTDDDGKTYLFYVGFGEVDYGIYGCEVDVDSCVCGPSKLIISPADGTWETKEGRVTEGPFVIKHNGTYYLTYSGNGYTSKKYAVGYATSDTVLGDYTRYANNPILSQVQDSGVYGPGHHAFFTSASGTLMIVYHRHAGRDSVWPRVACIDRVFFVNTGEGPDVLAIAGPTVTPQPMP